MNVVKSELIFRRWQYPTSYDSIGKAIDVKEEEVLLVMSTWHAVGLCWVPGHAGVWGNEIASELARDGSALKFAGPEPALGVSRQDLQRRIRRWLVNQQWVWWQGLGNTQRQACDFISGPCLGAKARFLSFNRTQSIAVSGIFIGHNTLRRHFHKRAVRHSTV